MCSAGCLTRDSFLAAGLENRHLPEDVALHGQQASVRVRQQLRGGHQASHGGRLRLPHGVHHVGLRRPARLQPHPDWRPPRLQGLRNRHAQR